MYWAKELSETLVVLFDLAWECAVRVPVLLTMLVAVFDFKFWDPIDMSKLGQDTVYLSNPFDDPPTVKNASNHNVFVSFSPAGAMQSAVAPPYLEPVAQPSPLNSLSSLSARVYPSDQPMIFTSSNPNAPPICPCGKCHREIHDNDQAIQCYRGCKFWFHRTCVGLTEDAWHMIVNEPYAEWVCDPCLASKQIPWVIFTNS
ncbi:unnamed protein product [Soboliphyme baturini]|uniref:PHD-type domain-containing protein n=1 Tax=Soboliphyme baturini TaxID=241478 RepID=A0A183IJ68_9BILA|nr:unnamed protein product [Soboliphyme baturini]